MYRVMINNYSNHMLPVTKYYLRPLVFEVGYHARKENHVITKVYFYFFPSGTGNVHANIV